MSNRFWRSRLLIAVVIGLFSSLLVLQAMPQADNAGTEAKTQGKESYEKSDPGQTGVEAESTSAEAAEKGGPQASFRVKETPAPQVVKKKKFPWLLVIAGAVVVGVAVYFLVLKKPKYKLDVTLGEGVQGTPGAGSTEYKKGKAVAYSYQLQSGYKNLQVKLDGAVVAASGQVKMNAHHSLAVSSEKLAAYTLKVSIGAGISGTPADGIYTYNEGDVVTYNYALQSEYSQLHVTLDNVGAAASGSFTMTGNRALKVTAHHDTYFTLLVGSVWSDGRVIDDLCIFRPADYPTCGTHRIKKGATVEFNYRNHDPEGYCSVLLIPSLTWPPGNMPYEQPGVITLGDAAYDQHATGSFVMSRDCSLFLSYTYD